MSQRFDLDDTTLFTQPYLGVARSEHIDVLGFPIPLTLIGRILAKAYLSIASSERNSTAKMSLQGLLIHFGFDDKS